GPDLPLAPAGVAVAPRLQADRFVQVTPGIRLGHRLGRIEYLDAAVGVIDAVQIVQHRLVGVLPAMQAMPVARGDEHFGEGGTARDLAAAAIVNDFVEARLQLLLPQRDDLSTDAEAEPVWVPG